MEEDAVWDILTVFMLEAWGVLGFLLYILETQTSLCPFLSSPFPLWREPEQIITLWATSGFIFWGFWELYIV